MPGKPLLIAVAPNGARKTKLDHPRLPLDSPELIKTAVDCLEAGAAMMHFHVRDSAGKHTLDHEIYAPVLRELEAAVGEKMLLQVSSEAAGVYQSEEQIEHMRRLAPHCLSCGLLEIFPDRQDFSAGNSFLSTLHSEGVLLQIILYSAAEVGLYEKLCTDGVIPGRGHLLLFVLGRYGHYDNADLAPYLAALQGDNPWMICGFGRQEQELMGQAVRLGGHCRVGFENNQLLPDGSSAPDNATLVKYTAGLAHAAGRVPGDRRFAESLHGWDR